jgi:hypothetical protein
MGDVVKTFTVAIVMAVLLLPALPGLGQEAQMQWKDDFKRQPLASRPKIEARYSRAARDRAEIEAQNYVIALDLKAESGQRMREFKPMPSLGSVNLLKSNGAYLRLTDSAGDVFTSLNTKTPSRINIYRRGPYYIETHWLDVQLTNDRGDVAPVKGEVVFYSYPEKTHVGVILHVVEPIEVKSAGMVFDFNAVTCATPSENSVCPTSFFLLKRDDKSPSCALLYPVPSGVDDVTVEKIDQGVRVCNFVYNGELHDGAAAQWGEGDKTTAYFELFPLAKSQTSEELEAELKPLISTSITATNGRSLGYDPIRGCYTLQTDNPGDFNYHFYENKNDYETASFGIENNNIDRKVYVLHETRKQAGSVECGVLLDEQGYKLPVTVQISKNFSCEVEEPFYNPKDTPFSETIFPLYLKAGENRKLHSLHLYQNWGAHPLKQFSSLGAWMDYFHMSTGVTETTCYVPFLFAGLPGVTIADFRPMSQIMWDSQPQHDNIAGHSFLRYLDAENKWHFIEYTGTTFRSTGPNWADMSMSYLSDDGRAKVNIDVFEAPQADELRNFVHLRVDFLDTIAPKDGNIAENVRLLMIASWVQGMRYTNVAFGGPTGNATVTPIKLNDLFTVNAAPIPAENGWAAAYPDVRGANAYIVRRFEGKIAGKPVKPGVSLIGKKDGNTELYLVPIADAKEIVAGDYLDIDLILMPYGGGTQDEKPAQKCANDFGANAPKITSVTTGAKISDFPTRIALDSKGRAEFSVTGGVDCIPIIVEGAKDYASLRLYNADGAKKIIELSREGEKDGYQVFAKEDGTFGYVFLVESDGKEHKYVAE